MPNWCNNDVVITHSDPARLEALAAAVRESNFCNFAIPVPEDLQIVAGRVGADSDPEQIDLEAKTKSNIEKHGFANWYDFCVNRWGTKWDIEAYEGENVKVENGRLEFGFDSAWSPPLGVYEELVEQGFDVVAYYHESGMAFCGRWDNGNDDYYEYAGYSSKDVRDVIGEDIDDHYDISDMIAEYEEEENKDE